MYRDPTGRKKSAGTFDGKRLAQQAANTAEVTAKTGRPSSDVTWGEWERQWTASRTVATSTALEDHKRIERHVRPRWGHVRLDKITRADVQQWSGELTASGLSASTVRKIVGVLSASMRAALRLDVIEVNPCTDLEQPKLAPSPEHWLSTDEVAAVREVLDDRYALTFELLLGTGMRWGEGVGLHWDHVDLEQGSIEVVWSWDRKGRTFKPPKSHQKRRVPIGDHLVGLLDARLEAVGFGEPPAGIEYDEMRRPAHGLVLAVPGGTPPNGTSFAHGLSAAGRAAFVGKGARRRRVGDIRPHDLRHTYASKLVQGGVPIQQVSKLLGHSSLTVTQRYASLGDSQWDSVRNVLG